MGRTFKVNEVEFHQSVDNSDPGFTLKGFKLRWLSGHVASRRAGRIWDVLKTSQIPEECLKKFMTKQYQWFSKDSDTIRKGDLTLAYAPLDLVKERREELANRHRVNSAPLRGEYQGEHGMVSTVEKDTALGKNEASQYK